MTAGGRPGRARGLLDEASTRRVVVVTGAAGWGKTSAVAEWAESRQAVWVGAGEHDRLLRPIAGDPARLRRPGAGELFLVVDDVQAVSAENDSVAVLETICQNAPDWLHVLLLSRAELPFSLARLRGRGMVAEIDATHLAVRPAEIHALVQATVGDDPPGLAALIHQCTAGWPVAVRAVVEMMRDVAPGQRAAVLRRLTAPGERFHGFLTEEVLGQESPAARATLRRLAVLGEIRTPGPEQERLLTELTRRGLVARAVGDALRWSLIRPLAHYFSHEAVLSTRERVELHLEAGRRYLSEGAPADALRHLASAGAHSACAALLVEHGDALVVSGHGDAVLEAAGLPTEFLDDPRIHQVVGEAQRTAGHWAAAMESFRRASRFHEELDAALGWRIGMLAFTQGEFGNTLDVLGRTRLGDEDTQDEARALALLATTCRMVGETARARQAMARAEAAAVRSGTPGARAAIHQVLAMLAAAEPDRREADVQCLNALHSAQAAGDLLQVGWIRVCHAFHACDMGSPRQALAEAKLALRTSEQCGCPFLTGHAHTVRARAYLSLGALDEAAADLGTAVDTFQRLGSRFLAWPLCVLGDLHRTRGQLVRATADYEEALVVAQPHHDLFALGHALIGLARVRAADDLAAARTLADRALGMREGLLEIPARLTSGWVALLAQDRERAAADASRAAKAARLRRDGPGLAEAITLGVLASADPAARADLLDEAVDLWHEHGCRLEEAVTRVVAARVGAPVPDADVCLAEETLRAAGVDIGGRRAAGPLAASRPSGPAVFIRALGAFQVVVDGTPVPKTAWQSRKARDLLKILVTRRRPVPREQLMELLWPEADPVKAGNRLSVLLSLVRDVLRQGQSAGGPLASDGGAVWLDRSRVRVDLEEFLTGAEEAARADRAGQADATARLTAAAAACTGEVLEDEPYQEWAPLLAEEVRATHFAVLRALASRLRQAGDVDGAVRYTLRLLAKDVYDEEAYLMLIATLRDAGRLGEARRYERIYHARMKEMGIAPHSSPLGRLRSYPA